MPLDFEIWLDTHISPVIAKWLKEDFGYNCKLSFVLKLYGLDDIEIYQKAKAAGYVISISKDSDLPEIVERLGAPPKVINIRIGNADNRILFQLLKENIEHGIRLLTQFGIKYIELNFSE